MRQWQTCRSGGRARDPAGSGPAMPCASGVTHHQQARTHHLLAPTYPAAPDPYSPSLRSRPQSCRCTGQLPSRGSAPGRRSRLCEGAQSRLRGRRARASAGHGSEATREPVTEEGGRVAEREGDPGCVHIPNSACTYLSLTQARSVCVYLCAFVWVGVCTRVCVWVGGGPAAALTPN